MSENNHVVFIKDVNQNEYDIRKLREQARLSYKDVADRAGALTPNGYAKIEKGLTKNPNPATISRILKVFGIQEPNLGELKKSYQSPDELIAKIAECDAISFRPRIGMNENNKYLFKMFLDSCMQYFNAKQNKDINQREIKKLEAEEFINRSIKECLSQNIKYGFYLETSDQSILYISQYSNVNYSMNSNNIIRELPETADVIKFSNYQLDESGEPILTDDDI